jgi:phage protein U
MASLSGMSADFVFTLHNTPLASHQRVSGSACKETPILAAKPRTELVGGVLERRVLEGVCYGQDASEHIDTLFQLKDIGQPVVLMIASDVLGQWMITLVRQTNTETLPDGTHRKTTFSVQLQEYAND